MFLLNFLFSEMLKLTLLIFFLSISMELFLFLTKSDQFLDIRKLYALLLL